MTEDEYVDFGIQQLEHAMMAQVDPSAVAAIIIEPVQGEAGFLPVPPRFLQRIRELCEQHGIVMIADEVQCGSGRTGRHVRRGALRHRSRHDCLREVAGRGHADWRGNRPRRDHGLGAPGRRRQHLWRQSRGVRGRASKR